MLVVLDYLKSVEDAKQEIKSVTKEALKEYFDGMEMELCIANFTFDVCKETLTK